MIRQPPEYVPRLIEAAAAKITHSGTSKLPRCPGPAAARGARMRPPINAWEDEDGRPKYQVMRFHAIAPIRAANTRTRPSCPCGVPMMPLPIVLATLVDTNAPARLNTAAMP